MPMVAKAARPKGSGRFGAPRVKDDGTEATHNGIDLYADKGDPVTSPEAGTVVIAHDRWVKGFGDYGRVVVVALDSGGEVLAGHLDRVTVQPGERVKRGDQIGTVGDTRFSDDNPTGNFAESAPHTHVEFLTGHSYPVRKEVPRQDPTALAFYGVARPTPAKPQLRPKPTDAEVFASIQDVVDRADALLNRWNALVSQVYGPTASGRDDIPRTLQDAIIKDRQSFRDFITRPTFGLWGADKPRQLGRYIKADYYNLGLWYKTYEARANQVAQALPSGESLKEPAKPVALPRSFSPLENLESAAKLAAATAEAVLFGVGIAAVLGLGLAVRRALR